MRRRISRDAANDGQVAKQGNVVFWMTLVAGLTIAVVLVVLIAR